MESVDLTELSEIAGVSEQEQLKAIIESAYVKLTTSIHELFDDIHKTSAAELLAQTHALKSVASYAAAKPIEQLLISVEMTIKNNDIFALGALYGALNAELEQLGLFIDRLEKQSESAINNQ